MGKVNRVVLLIAGIISFFNGGGLLWANTVRDIGNKMILQAAFWIIAGFIFLYFSYRSWENDDDRNR